MKCTNAFFLLIWVLLFSANVWSLDTDARQPIYIESDAATYDEKKGESVYTGNVQVTQGSMRMNSDRLVILMSESGEKELNKMIATGNPVRFKQKPSDDKEEIRGKSLRVEYYGKDGKLILLEKAKVVQGSNTYTSERIEYDTKNSIVKAGAKDSNTKRVHVTLHPNK